VEQVRDPVRDRAAHHSGARERAEYTAGSMNGERRPQKTHLSRAGTEFALSSFSGKIRVIWMGERQPDARSPRTPGPGLVFRSGSRRIVRRPPTQQPRLQHEEPRVDARGRMDWCPDGRLLGEDRSEVPAGGRRDRPGEATAWADHGVELGWLPVAALLLADDGSAVAVNDAWTALSKLGPDESMGEGWLNAIEPLDRAALRARLRLAVTVGESGSADCNLTVAGGLRRSRWWWQPGSAGELVVCVADIGGYMDRPDAWWLPADTGTDAAAAAYGGISRDRATTVIHRVFGAALILESAASLVGGQGSSRLQQAVAELDALIRDVRMAVIEPLTSSEPGRLAPPNGDL
jgi:hypothetical protein